jgi:hypothetical protein
MKVDVQVRGLEELKCELARLDAALPEPPRLSSYAGPSCASRASLSWSERGVAWLAPGSPAVDRERGLCAF